MSTLNSLFNRATLGTRCKTCLNLAISRIKLLRNKREAQLKLMCKEIAQYLETGQEAISRIRVEHVIREQNTLAAYEIIELFCEFILARVPILDTQRDCPVELQEAVASVIFASPRCSDLPELMNIRNLFSTKYGKDFVAAASELRPGSNVNRTIIEKLTVRAPAAEVKVKVLKAIAQEYNVEWDSSTTEAELSKTHEDLLDGSKSVASLAPAFDKSVTLSSPKGGVPENSIKEYKSKQLHQPSFHKSSNDTSVKSEISATASNTVETLGQSEGQTRVDKAVASSSDDVLEKARAAIAMADRASAAARAAADLVKVQTNQHSSSVGNGN